MCGICGKLIFDREASVSSRLVKTMADTMHHRGPDDEGYYFSGPLGLGFRRLSIIDLKTGHQPISNEDGSIWIVFNGEIYNYQELRAYLLTRGHLFSTGTDTEVIVHLYEEFGETCVDRLRGMFGFAIWDDRRKTLFLARDRVGIKPLYYYVSEKSLIFASEIKAILADPEVRREVAPQMIDRLLTFNYLPGPGTLFKNIHKLEPGSYMVVQSGKWKIRQYWDLVVPQSALSLKEVEARLSSLLDETVRLHMISDVPVGVLLSGGFDSTALLSIASESTDRRISTFTVGFSEPGTVDERSYARLAAGRFGSDHHEITISSREFEDFLPKYVWHMEEPICEPPAIALYFVSKLAKQFVKVLISGEGGDEAFAGYPNYRNLLWIESLKGVVGPFNGALAGGLSKLNNLLHSRRLEKYSTLLTTPFEAYYYSRTSVSSFQAFSQRIGALYTKDFARSVDRKFSVSGVDRYLNKSGVGKDRVNQMLYVDTKTWLPDDLLLKADKITMANSVELRVPFLDHKMLEFAASLPGQYKVRGFATKYVAKRALRRRVPAEILKRKKAGFPVPYGRWLRTEMKEWLRDILLDGRTLGRGYFRREGIEQLISADLAFGGHSKELFSLAALELWHRAFLDSSPRAFTPQSHEFLAETT
jgi:asparagine synthase (glutamine-hydrolysing)